MRSQFQIDVSVDVSLCHLSSVYSEALGPLAMRQSPHSFLTIGARTTDRHLSPIVLSLEAAAHAFLEEDGL